MKKIFSVMMLCLCCMAFVSCEKEEEVDVNAFKSCAFQAEPAFSEDVLNLYNITLTYTAMDGSVKVLTPNEKGAIPVLDETEQLPASMKFELKAVKKANFDEYMNSKETFDLLAQVPYVQARYLTVGGEKKTLFEEAGQRFYVNVGRESALIALEESIFPKMNVTVEGTFTKSGNICKFVKK